MPTNLPLEVWRIVFGDVVPITGALETTMTTQFEWFEWRYNEERKYAESMANRLSLVRVCKAWYSLAVELLYEDIRLDSLGKLESLIIALGEPVLSGSHIGRGWWTQRLDLPDSAPIPDTQFYPLIECFPNLRILCFSDLTRIPYQIGDSLPKLRYTHLEPNYPHIPTNLSTLLLVLTVGRYEHTFSNVTSLEIYFNCHDPSILRGYSFPNVRHLTLSNNISTDLPAIEAFLHQYGHQLLSLHINSSEICPAIEQLLSKAPNIREIIVPCYRLPPFEGNTFLSVTHIGLIVNGGSIVNPFLAIPRFPNVKCIRMVGMVFTTTEGAVDMLQAWYRGSRFIGVRFEDAERNILVMH